MSGAPGPWQLEQVVEIGHPHVPGALEQGMEHVGRGHRIVQGPVVGDYLAPEVGGESAQPEVAHLLSDQAAGQGRGVDEVVAERRITQLPGGCVEKREVEADVVPHHHRVAEELEKGGVDGLDRRRLHHHCLGDPGEERDRGGYREPGIDQCLE